MPATGLILFCIHPHFIDTKTKAQRGKVTLPPTIAGKLGSLKIHCWDVNPQINPPYSYPIGESESEIKM